MNVDDYVEYVPVRKRKQMKVRPLLMPLVWDSLAVAGCQVQEGWFRGDETEATGRRSSE